MVIRRGPLIIITTLIVMKSNQHKKGDRIYILPKPQGVTMKCSNQIIGI